MPALTGNLENRVRKLSKPSTYAQALQPVFEAISNSFFAIEDRFGEDIETLGKVSVEVARLSDPASLEITITDNGVGLDADRFEAFCVVDTDFKANRGGKGVGRLFWLDAFSDIYVESSYIADSQIKTFAFRFLLSATEQVQFIEPEGILPDRRSPGTGVRFRGIRSKDYAHYFPKEEDTFRRYFAAHFISDFLRNASPKVELEILEESWAYPEEVARLVVGSKMETGAFEVAGFGEMALVGFTCDPEASTGLDGQHQLHLLANGRTVQTRKVDNLLGLTALERDGRNDLVFHGCLSGEFLDTRVNEGRTGFNLDEADLKRISRLCIDTVKERLLPEQVLKFEEERRKKYEAFVARHPIYGFDEADVQLDRVPFHATKAEDFAAGLVKYQIRREEDRHKALQAVLAELESGDFLSDTFAETVIDAANGIQKSEQLALAQHVVRRKLVLEILEKLLARVRRKVDRPDDHHLEKTLHTLICPMGVRGDDPTEFKSRAHDLWIIDERLAFTRAFASDERLDQLLASGGSAQRPDLILWDLAFGMGVTDPEKSEHHVDVSKPLDKVMVVEFKKPGRRTYRAAEDQIEHQITKYLAQLQNGDIESFDKRRVRVSHDCIFYCYVVADIVGDLELQLSSWETTANGQGRIRALKGRYNGFIEVIQWQDLVNDAWMRNQATLFAAGLKRSEPIELISDGGAAEDDQAEAA